MYCLLVCVRCNVTSRHHLYWPVILYSVSRDHYPCTSSVTRFYFSEATSYHGSRVLSAYWLVRGTTQQLATRIVHERDVNSSRGGRRNGKRRSPSSCTRRRASRLARPTWCDCSVQPRPGRLERIRQTPGTLFVSERHRIIRQAAHNLAQCRGSIDLPSHPYVGIA